MHTTSHSTSQYYPRDSSLKRDFKALGWFIRGSGAQVIFSPSCG